MTQYLSDKIKVLSLFSIILVLYIHSGFHDYPHEIQGMAFNFTLQGFISGKIGRCAVPLFFAISGYLFFRNIDIKAGRRECYSRLWTKMRKRCRTLVVPYVIACLFPVAFQLVLEQVPAARPFMNGGGFSENFSKTVSQLFYMIYIDSGNGSPYAFQLWFLRDLIVIVALSPIVLMIKRLGNRGGYYLLAVLFVVNTVMPSTPGFVYGMFWFLLGDCLLEKLSMVKTWVVPMLFLTACVIEIMFPSDYWNYGRMVIITLGVTSMWTAYDRLVPSTFILRDLPWLSIACAYTFFIYLYHEPTLNIVRKILVIPFDHTSFGFAFSYLASPWIFAAIWICVGIVFRRYLPRVYGVCMGGR